MDVDAVVIGAGQAGLSAAYHLKRLGIDFVVLDANPAAGGAWQHRWDSLTMHDVHGVADLPGADAPAWDRTARANVEVPRYFAEYERRFDLPVERPVRVLRVESEALREHGDRPSPEAAQEPARLLVHTDRGTWRARSLVNATGTWDRPFLPHYPGVETFRGEQFHTASYPGPAALAGKRVVVIGGGASAVQFLGELAGVADLAWVTRRPPVWRTSDFNSDAGREAVALVEERVKRGLPPESVVSVTGLMLRDQERTAREMGIYDARREMFTSIEPDGVRFADGSFQPADVLLWATGFRPSIKHLAPLGLRSPEGGIELLAPRDPHTFTTSAVDGRIHFVGYGPSASTIGATRAGRVAALAVRDQLTLRK